MASEIAETLPEFDVIFSYAREDRKSVEQVKTALTTRTLRVFDYQDVEAQAQLVGGNLFEKLENLYQKSTFVCVIFCSADYVEKYWTSREYEHARKRAWSEGNDFFVPVMCDKTELRGLPPEIVYEQVDSPEKLERLAGIVAHKVRKIRKRERIKRWRDRLPYLIAAALLLLALAAAAVLLKDPSIDLVRVDGDKATVHVRNGWRPTELSNFRVTFKGIPVEDTRLVMPGAEFGAERLSPFGRADVLLRAREFRTKCNPQTSSRPPYSEIERLFPGSSATFAMDVRRPEQSEPPAVWSKTLPIKDVMLFLKEKVPEYEYPCEAAL
ncbi:MAG TPA: toll/interleukin-1 receptor domain-containing protein [Thermoanaerobaculia bacterium]|nr:toll/interleukin-1 receptor domain-containing protein [Thermoanaerobaculia bacterium]